MVKAKHKVIKTFCFRSTLHVICTKDFLKEARLGASFDSVSRREVSLAALGLSQYFVDYTKNQTSWQQAYCKKIWKSKPISRFIYNNLQFILDKVFNRFPA